jgi:hypothetical protein
VLDELQIHQVPVLFGRGAGCSTPAAEPVGHRTAQAGRSAKYLLDGRSASSTMIAG